MTTIGRTIQLRQLVLPAIALLVMLVAASCTRERPATDVTPTVDAVMETPATTPTPATAGGEPEVTAAPTSAEAGEEGTDTTASDQAQDRGEYEVESGDTLFSVAQKFSTSPQVIRELNFLVGDIIQVGQRLIVPIIPPTPVPTAAPVVHVVQSGETLGQIAQIYGISQVDIIQANEITDPNAVFVGMELLIPGLKAEQPAEEAGSGEGSSGSGDSAVADSGELAVHVVQPGETLSEIAQQYDVTSDDIARINNLTNRNQLRVGQSLTIPGVTAAQATAARQIRHTVQAGETLLSISRKYGVDAGDIQAANNLSDPNAIIIGQELLIPQE